MEMLKFSRRSFFATLLAPLVTRFVPKAKTSLPVDPHATVKYYSQILKLQSPRDLVQMVNIGMISRQDAIDYLEGT